MSLITDIIPYTDGNGLVAPSLVIPGTIRASDNGPLYTSQLILLAALNNEVSPICYYSAITKCIDSNSNLHRAPDDTTQDAPDDYIGVSSALFQLSLPWSICQPMIVYIQRLNHGFWPIRLLSPLAALIIALSNINEAQTDTSNKMLTWTLIEGLKSRSWLCALAGKFWTYRMKRIYNGSTVGIPTIYFGASHPFVTYWPKE